MILTHLILFAFFPGASEVEAPVVLLRAAVFGVFTIEPRVGGTFTLNDEPQP